MEGSQALISMDKKSSKMLSTSHARDHLLFITLWAKLAVTPSLGKFWDDRTLQSDRPDAPYQRLVALCRPHVTMRSTGAVCLNG